MKRLAVLLPLALLAACGGGDDPKVEAGLSKADYITRAEAVCAKANKDIDALTAPTTPAAISSYISSIVTIAEQATDSLKALAPPAADKEDLENKVLEPLAAQVEEGKAYQKQIADAVKANDSAKLGQLVQDPPTQTEADIEFMRSYGFTECVESAKTE